VAQALVPAAPGLFPALGETYLPATLTAPAMSDDQYGAYLIEMTADGEILIMPPNFPLTGARNKKTGFQLSTRCFGNYASWIRVAQRSAARVRCGMVDFVIELRSQIDRLSVLSAKMQERISNGSNLPG
jgi:hypothetical protein